MKKGFAILLLLIHLYNICGYRLFFSVAEKNADKQIIALLDKNNYSEDELIQIKFALNAPYIQSKNAYERCDGEIEYNGVQYNYVKRLVNNDTLYLYCIPNKEKTAISNSKNLLAKQNADNTSGKASEQAASKKINLFNDYNSELLSFNFDADRTSGYHTISFNKLTTLKGFITKHLQPPDLFI